MKKVLPFIRDSTIAGIFVLVPILVMVFLFEKVWRVLHPFVARSMARLGLEHPAVLLVLTAVALIAGCFLLGVLLRFPMVTGIRGWFEESLLRFIPGYQYFRMILGERLGVEKGDFVAILAEIDGWQPALLVEEIPDGRCVVYIPGVPDTTSGSVHVVSADAIRHLDAPLATVMKSVRFYGRGLGPIAGRVTTPNQKL
jgi:uncharacterized membrane protein